MGRLAIAVAMVASLASGARSDESEDLRFLAHYDRALRYEGVGVGLGLGFGILAAIGGNDESMEYALVFGGLGGGLVGTAYGANTATEWQEQNGSFGLDLLGALGAGVATVFAGYGVSQCVSNHETRAQISGWSGVAVIGTVPLGAVLVQRVVAGNPPSLAVWHPRDASPETIGVVARWALR